ncbi:MAG: hypothetical protein PHP53_24660 [Prolixibacteraceae bacterium]|nr:hypothetical protein [Prolixibacteraceae bacterium]MDD2856518.1 hypothetical protein [Desulfuromonadaceae bacterium]
MKYDDNIVKYDKHPSPELVKLFMEKPFQGQDPARAKVIIIGNDANYSPQISAHPFFHEILEYHFDGIGFWKKHKKHHPFLLPNYPFDRRKGGVRYHLNFNKMQFTSDDAEHFSFVELLNVPTIGNTGSDKRLFFDMLNRDHLNWLENIVLSGKKKFVIVNQTLATSINRIYKELGVLRKLCQLMEGKEAQSVVLENNNVILYNGYSFSYSVSNDNLVNLRNKIAEFLEKH